VRGREKEGWGVSEHVGGGLRGRSKVGAMRCELVLGLRSAEGSLAATRGSGRCRQGGGYRSILNDYKKISPKVLSVMNIVPINLRRFFVLNKKALYFDLYCWVDLLHKYILLHYLLLWGSLGTPLSLKRRVGV
jgi:hypothetical protein